MLILDITGGTSRKATIARYSPGVKKDLSHLSATRPQITLIGVNNTSINNYVYLSATLGITWGLGAGRAMCRVGEERVGEPESKRFGVSVSEYVSQDPVSVEWWRSIPSGCLWPLCHAHRVRCTSGACLTVASETLWKSNWRPSCNHIFSNTKWAFDLRFQCIRTP